MTELIVNLWAFYDAQMGLIYALAGKAYSASGCDEEKLALLNVLSRTDYTTVKRYNLPDNFSVSWPDGTEKTKVAMLKAVDNPGALFSEMFKNLETDLPPQMQQNGDELFGVKQRIPQDPLCSVTVLYEDEDGNIRPIITDEDRAWIAHHEAMHGR